MGVREQAVKRDQGHRDAVDRLTGATSPTSWLFLLERFLQSHRDQAAVQALGDVTTTLKTALACNLVGVACWPTRNVRYCDMPHLDTPDDIFKRIRETPRLGERLSDALPAV